MSIILFWWYWVGFLKRAFRMGCSSEMKLILVLVSFFWRHLNFVHALVFTAKITDAFFDSDGRVFWSSLEQWLVCLSPNSGSQMWHMWLQPQILTELAPGRSKFWWPFWAGNGFFQLTVSVKEFLTFHWFSSLYIFMHLFLHKCSFNFFFIILDIRWIIFVKVRQSITFPLDPKYDVFRDKGVHGIYATSGWRALWN